MLIPSNNKNSLINFERNHWKHQKSQISISLKFSLKCMKKKKKRKGRIVLPVLEDKNLWEKLRENNKKNCFEYGSVEERERERAFWKILNSEEHMKISCFKKLSKRFSIDRKLHSIDPASIEPDIFKPKF